MSSSDLSIFAKLYLVFYLFYKPSLGRIQRRLEGNHCHGSSLVTNMSPGLAKAGRGLSVLRVLWVRWR
jgi:hypothetical protein